MYKLLKMEKIYTNEDEGKIKVEDEYSPYSNENENDSNVEVTSNEENYNADIMDELESIDDKLMFPSYMAFVAWGPFTPANKRLPNFKDSDISQTYIFRT